VRVLLDENLPEGLVEPLRLLGHTVDSVASLRLKGLDNGRLYREVASATARGSIRSRVRGEFYLHGLGYR
jgi:hypothetical protein